jgi:hypothetical protein
MSVKERTRAVLRLPLGWLSKRAAASERRPPLEQSAWDRGKVDTSRWASGAPVRFGLVTVAGVAACAAAAAALSASASLLVQVAIAVVGAALGFALSVGAVTVYFWARAPSVQRDELRAASGKGAGAAATDATHARVEAQFAQAVLTGKALKHLDEVGVPLVVDWRDSTHALIADTFGAVDASRFATREQIEEQREYLDGLAARVGEIAPAAPSASWELHLIRVSAFYEALRDASREGAALHAGLLRGTAHAAAADAWCDGLSDVLDLMPGFVPFSHARGPALGLMATYEGVNDETTTRALNRMDSRLPYLEAILPELQKYLYALR